MWPASRIPRDLSPTASNHTTKFVICNIYNILTAVLGTEILPPVFPMTRRPECAGLWTREQNYTVRHKEVLLFRGEKYIYTRKINR